MPHQSKPKDLREDRALLNASLRAQGKPKKNSQPLRGPERVIPRAENLVAIPLDKDVPGPRLHMVSPHAEAKKHAQGEIKFTKQQPRVADTAAAEADFDLDIVVDESAHPKLLHSAKPVDAHTSPTVVRTFTPRDQIFTEVTPAPGIGKELLPTPLSDLETLISRELVLKRRIADTTEQLQTTTAEPDKILGWIKIIEAKQASQLTPEQKAIGFAYLELEHSADQINNNEEKMRLALKAAKKDLVVLKKAGRSDKETQQTAEHLDTVIQQSRALLNADTAWKDEAFKLLYERHHMSTGDKPLASKAA